MTNCIGPFCAGSFIYKKKKYNESLLRPFCFTRLCHTSLPLPPPAYTYVYYAPLPIGFALSGRKHSCSFRTASSPFPSLLHTFSSITPCHTPCPPTLYSLQLNALFCHLHSHWPWKFARHSKCSFPFRATFRFVLGSLFVFLLLFLPPSLSPPYSLEPWCLADVSLFRVSLISLFLFWAWFTTKAALAAATASRHVLGERVSRASAALLAPFASPIRLHFQIQFN